MIDHVVGLPEPQNRLLLGPSGYACPFLAEPLGKVLTAFLATEEFLHVCVCGERNVCLLMAIDEFWFGCFFFYYLDEVSDDD